MSYHASIVRADGSEEERCMEKKLTLEEMQEIIGGYIQLIPCETAPGDVLADEDGRSKRLPFNNAASFAVGRTLVGTVLFLDYRID